MDRLAAHTGTDELCDTELVKFPSADAFADDAGMLFRRWQFPEFSPEYHGQVLPEQLPCLDGDWYYQADDAIKGLTLPLAAFLTPSAGQEIDSFDSRLPTEDVLGDVESFDGNRPDIPAHTQSEHIAPCCERTPVDLKLGLADVKFSECHLAPFEPTDPFFGAEATTAVRVPIASPAETANRVFKSLYGKEGVVILKVRPCKFSLKAAVMWSRGLSCELKIYVYATAAGARRNLHSCAGGVQQLYGSVVDFQRRAGDSVAFSKIVNMVREDLMLGISSESYARVHNGVIGTSVSESDHPVVSSLTPATGLTCGGRQCDEPIDAFGSTSETIIVSRCDDDAGTVGIDPCGESRDGISGLLSPLLDVMSRHHINEADAQAEVASALQAATESDTNSIMCLSMASTTAWLVSLLSADEFRVVYPAARALAVIAQTPGAIESFFGCSGSSLLPTLTFLVLDKLKLPYFWSSVKEHLARSLYCLLRCCGTWLSTSGAAQEVGTALQHLLCAPSLGAKVNVQTRSWLEKTLSVLKASTSIGSSFDS